MFLSEEEETDSLTVLNMIMRGVSAISSTVVPMKGTEGEVSSYAVAFAKYTFDEWRTKKCILQTDQEPAILSWAEAVKLAAADLFDLAASVVERWVEELTAKAVALAGS